jgi:hypothetical protein
MNSEPENKPSKPVFARISPKMSRSEIKRNIIEALKKSGIILKQDMNSAADEDRGDK